MSAGRNEATCVRKSQFVCAVKNKQAVVGMGKKRESSVYLTGSSGDVVQTSPLEEKPQEPLGWGTAKHLTLSSAGPHSFPPFIFVFSSIPGPLPSHHVSLEGQSLLFFPFVCSFLLSLFHFSSLLVRVTLSLSSYLPFSAFPGAQSRGLHRGPVIDWTESAMSTLIH